MNSLWVGITAAAAGVNVEVMRHGGSFTPSGLIGAVIVLDTGLFYGCTAGGNDFRAIDFTRGTRQEQLRQVAAMIGVSLTINGLASGIIRLFAAQISINGSLLLTGLSIAGLLKVLMTRVPNITTFILANCCIITSLVGYELIAMIVCGIFKEGMSGAAFGAGFPGTAVAIIIGTILGYINQMYRVNQNPLAGLPPLPLPSHLSHSKELPPCA